MIDSLEGIGAPGENRTPDLLLVKQQVRNLKAKHIRTFRPEVGRRSRLGLIPVNIGKMTRLENSGCLALRYGLIERIRGRSRTIHREDNL
jgi:hypothetical protein